MQRLLVLTISLVIAALPTSAADFWEQTEYLSWTDKEVAKMLSGSPWAKRLNVTLEGLPMSRGGMPYGGGGGGSGGRGGGGGQRAGVQGASGRSALPSSNDNVNSGNAAIPPSMSLTIRFQSALPIKQALIKRNLGEGTEPTPEMQRFLDRSEEHYVVAVEGLPAQVARMGENNNDTLTKAAVLRRKGQDPIAAEKVDVRAGETTRLFYYFPRSDEITASDKEVEFFMKLERPSGAGRGEGQGGGRRGGGALFGKEIKTKFRLRDMAYRGRLAL